MERRDGTHIQLTILYQLALSGGKVPLHTRDGLRFKLALHDRTLKRAIAALEKQGLVERCTKPTPRGEVEAVKLSEDASQQIAKVLPLFNMLT